jgi:hypothetical protein
VSLFGRKLAWQSNDVFAIALPNPDGVNYKTMRSGNIRFNLSSDTIQTNSKQE